MLEQVLALFPPQTHAIFLVSDPDDVLADEAILTALHAQGFTLAREHDPVRLRHRVEQARPWSREHPLIVVSDEPLDTLPYDLWQQGHHVTLALHTFFPRLSYPEIRALTPAQRARLNMAPQPQQTLGRQATRRYLLRHVFDAVPEDLREPAVFLAWLDTYHRRPDPMPSTLGKTLLNVLKEEPAYADWPLRQLLADRQTLTTFVQTQWERYLQSPPRGEVAEPRVAYLDFAQDAGLQEIVGRLVRSGTLTPVSVAAPESTPGWAYPGILADESERLPQRLTAAFDALNAVWETLSADARWAEWQPLAWAWAELTATYYHPELTPTEAQAQTYQHLRQQVNQRFASWLNARYAALATQKLPRPHHLYHIPHYLAYHYAPQRERPVALIILDGLALADWTVIRHTWKARRPQWHWEENLVLAQIPTLTSISRQALVSGRRPADFADALTTTRYEPRHWQDFWRVHELGKRAAPYVRLRPRDANLPAELTSAHSRAICAVDVTLDDFVHNATLGTRDFYSSLHLWLQRDVAYLEAAIDTLLARNFVVALTGDHGHIEAVGIGQPREGILAETRGKRARLYEDCRTAEVIQETFPQTRLWHSQGLLPDNVCALMPHEHAAFTTSQATVVSHGGMTLDEVVVPFVIIAP